MYRHLSTQGITEFTSAIGRQYLISQFGEFDYATLSKRDKDVVKIINVLCEFYDTGTLVNNKERILLNGPIGELVKQFLAHLVSLRLKPSTINERKHYLSRFIISLCEHGVMSIDQKLCKS
ncbi:hypothetical protein [Arcticibacter svalbardensis]|uniref:hypothetical protein n=1 Tax=Arcticibacter svalbardensis TaxID=1288027 RepID=UPI00058CBBFC|nr:hypothetical protein [Arcticibacter svalbardensis]